MSDTEGPFLYTVPVGRRLDTGIAPEGMGTLSCFPKATPERIDAIGSRIPQVTLNRSSNPWTDLETGDEYELVRGLLDVVDPETSCHGFRGHGRWLDRSTASSGNHRRGAQSASGHTDQRGSGMTVAEYRRQRREAERRRTFAAQLAANKAEREQEAERMRSARASAAWAAQHQPLDRIPMPEPRVTWSGSFGGLRPSPTPRELARRSERVDQILFDLSS